ncbi:hypothetical protein TrLO_g114 [Triparma laevis f. longispina]|uniref:Uncharacterized protein n=1 Tax=Triparma laevis f. longispina TaxID=1714387 RepID=A0A9W7F8E6_9STRA|nr:hypothetical protein TrLO_g114 [Triparma laevis f. longispina]
MSEEKKADEPPQDVAEDNKAEDAVPVLPPGVKPFFVSDSHAQKLGMKTGEGIVDLLPSKFFNKEEQIAQVVELGFMCAFDPVMKEMKECPVEEFLVVTDTDSKFGEMFLLYYSGDAITGFTDAARIEEEKRMAEEKRLADIAAAKAAAEEARRNAVYVDEPMKSKLYVSESMEATVEEVKNEQINHERPLLSLSIGRNLSSCGQKLQLGDRDHDQTGIVEWQKTRFPEFDMNRMERDIGTQAAPEVGEGSTQTKWNRPVNMTTQYTAMGTGAGTSTSTGSGPDEEVPEIDMDSLAGMLNQTLGSVEAALQQNETVNIFTDAMAMVGDDDGAIGSKMENQLKELRNFTDLDFSKGKALSCIDWHPNKKGVLAVSVCKTMSFDERVEVSGQVDVAYVIIWEFAEWIKPQLVLQSPQECFSFKYNPTMPNIVVGGCYSGQAIIWDLNEAMADIEKKKLEKKSDKNGEDNEEQQPPVQPTAMSYIDTSHKRMVADITWLQPDCQINSKGQILAPEHLDDKTYQFMTIAGDGQALVWDIRYIKIFKGEFPHIFKPKSSNSSKNMKEGTKIPWLPLFRMNVKRLEGVGELSLCRLLSNLKSVEGDDTDKRSHILATSEEGDLVYADWRAKRKFAGKGDDDDDGANDVPEFVQWMAKDHNRPCVSLQQSPFFEDMILTVSDWTFNIWKLGHPKPVFSSPDASTYLTGGRWSPTRPGTVLICKEDGCVDVWDFTDSSYKPSATLMTTPSRITSMEFLTGKTATAKQQLLAIGDVVGSLHVFDVPRNLWKPVTNERNIIHNFFNREIKRMDFAEKRQHAREEEYSKKAAEEPEDDAPPPPQLEEGGGGGGGGDEGEGEGEGDDAGIMAEEEAYKNLEAKFIEQLGLTADDLPPGFDLSKVGVEE